MDAGSYQEQLPEPKQVSRTEKQQRLSAQKMSDKKDERAIAISIVNRSCNQRKEKSNARTSVLSSKV
jgi:hypothetical protein